MNNGSDQSLWRAGRRAAIVAGLTASRNGVSILTNHRCDPGNARRPSRRYTRPRPPRDDWSFPARTRSWPRSWVRTSRRTTFRESPKRTACGPRMCSSPWGSHTLWPWLAIPSRSDSTSCLMLLTTGSGNPDRSRMAELGAGVISLAMIGSYRNLPRNIKAIPRSGLRPATHPGVTRLVMDSRTVYAQRVVQPTWGGTVIHAEVTYPFSVGVTQLYSFCTRDGRDRPCRASAILPIFRRNRPIFCTFVD